MIAGPFRPWRFHALPRRRTGWRLGAVVLATSLLLGSPGAGAAEGGDGGDTASDVGEGAAITPSLARQLYEQLAPLREADGCSLQRFDTRRFSIEIGLQTRAGVARALQIAATPDAATTQRAGGWALAAGPELERECGTTLAAIERILAQTTAPAWAPQQPIRSLPQAVDRIVGGRWLTAAPSSYTLLSVSFALLVLGTLHILLREAWLQRPPPRAVLALVLVWGVALALRLTISPRTFLHEYYHVAETVDAYLTGELSPAYGKTGPALFRLAGWLFDRREDTQVIFLTNAVIASLAIPAVALLDLALMRSWPRALCAAVLLCVLPQHLRFSAAEDLFVQAITFGFWALGLFALYLRTRRLEDVLCAALALSLAMQARPEMLFFPAVLAGMVLLTEPGSWRVLIGGKTLLALAVLGVLLLPRLFEMLQVMQSGASPAASLPDVRRYLDSLVLLNGRVTPWPYWPLLVIGAVCGLWHTPGLVVWVALVFLAYTVFALSLFGNEPFNLRAQLLPTTYVVLIAAGAAPLWMRAWRERRDLAIGIGLGALALFGVVSLLRTHGFITELRDQQLEWAFLERTVPQLPQRFTLLTNVEVGGRNLDAFPEFLLQRARRAYQLVDVGHAVAGDMPWPAPGEDVLFYQGMFCYFAFDEEPSPDPMTARCRAVHERYVTEPLSVEELHTEGYSRLQYAPAPYRIGFFRLKAAR